MNSSISNTIDDNRATWNQVADLFVTTEALPIWAPFGVGEDLNLLPDPQGKVFLELACGSGRSIKYLTDKGAKKVYGLDISATQIKEASEFNAEKMQQGVAELICGTMEERHAIEPVDAAFSVYGFGWTQDPVTALAHVYDYLKPGGIFAWSWDHTYFTDVVYEDGKFVVKHPYHDEQSIERQNWRKPGCTMHLTFRKISTWFRLLRKAGFEVTEFLEPAPKSTLHAHAVPEQYYSLQKAELVPASFIFVCRRPL